MKYLCSAIVAVLLMSSVPSASAQTPVTALTNAEVAHLVALHVSDVTVISVINGARITQFDLNASAVGELTVLGVSSAVVAAMRHPSTPIPPPTPQPVSLTRTAPTAAELDRQKFARVYAAGKAVDLARSLGGFDAVDAHRAATGFDVNDARAVGGITPGQFQQLLFAFDVELSFVQDKVTTPAEWSLMWDYMLASAQFRLGLATYLIPGKRASDWACCGVDRMELASTTLNDANKIYLGK
jgi:hypothetical protein